MQTQPPNQSPNQTKSPKKPWGVILIIILSVILIFGSAFAFYTYSLIKKIKSGEISIGTNWQEAMMEPGPYDMANDLSPWIGAADPKITIVEFADFNCPFCKNSYPIIREISYKYKDSVKFIFRHYPVIQENSLALALATECAREQGKFWPVHDAMFQNENPAENIGKIAVNTGLDANLFSSCLQSQKYLNRIKMDFLSAQEAEINGTPAWFINGHKIEGEIPREHFFGIIDALLAQTKK